MPSTTREKLNSLKYERQKERTRLRVAKHRAKKKMAKFAARTPEERQPDGEPSLLLATWADGLKVPSGLLAGTNFVLPDWQRDFVMESMKPGIREAGLSVARKNGKSGLIALLLLCHLVGPLRSTGWRALVVSLTGRLAMELWQAMQAICHYNGLPAEFKRTPQPGIAIGLNDTRVDFLAADRATGHAVGADLAIIDEAGLLQEKERGLWNAMLSSVSGRDGKLICISIRGDGPMFGELAGRRDSQRVHFVEFAADPRMALDNEAAWHAANPGLATGIKSANYMRDMAERAMASPNDQAAFAAYDLNLPQEPSRELILSVSDWQACLVDDLPPREGLCCLGVDLGGSTSMTAAVAYWPDSGRLEVRGAFPSVPSLTARGDRDGVGGLYERMRSRGELKIYPGRVTNLPLWFDDLATWLGGQEVRVALDRYRQAEAVDAMALAGVSWPVQWRGMGHSHTADGSADVRAFQRLCLTGQVKTTRSLMMEAAIRDSAIARDAAGNPKLDKHRQKGRIDALQAGVLSLGMGARALVGGGKMAYHGLI